MLNNVSYYHTGGWPSPPIHFFFTGPIGGLPIWDWWLQPLTISLICSLWIHWRFKSTWHCRLKSIKFDDHHLCKIRGFLLDDWFESKFTGGILTRFQIMPHLHSRIFTQKLQQCVDTLDFMISITYPTGSVGRGLYIWSPGLIHHVLRHVQLTVALSGLGHGILRSWKFNG